MHSPLAYLSFLSPSMMRNIRDPSVLEAVVGDVLRSLPRETDFRVLYDQSPLVVNGVRLRPSTVSSKPRVFVGGELRNFFTLVLVDADFPSPSSPTRREYLHWLVMGIPGSTDASFGQEIHSYEPPQPTAGIHRLVFVLFRDKYRQTVRLPDGRRDFNTQAFAEQNALGPPVAAFYFNCQRENGTGGRRFM